LKDQGLQTKVAQPANAVGQNNCNLEEAKEVMHITASSAVGELFPGFNEYDDTVTFGVFENYLDSVIDHLDNFDFVYQGLLSRAYEAFVAEVVPPTFKFVRPDFSAWYDYTYVSSKVMTNARNFEYDSCHCGLAFVSNYEQLLCLATGKHKMYMESNDNYRAPLSVWMAYGMLLRHKLLFDESQNLLLPPLDDFFTMATGDRGEALQDDEICGPFSLGADQIYSTTYETNCCSAARGQHGCTLVPESFIKLLQRMVLCPTVTISDIVVFLRLFDHGSLDFLCLGNNYRFLFAPWVELMSVMPDKTVFPGLWGSDYSILPKIISRFPVAMHRFLGAFCTYFGTSYLYDYVSLYFDVMAGRFFFSDLDVLHTIFSCYFSAHRRTEWENVRNHKEHFASIESCLEMIYNIRNAEVMFDVAHADNPHRHVSIGTAARGVFCDVLEFLVFHHFRDRRFFDVFTAFIAAMGTKLYARESLVLVPGTFLPYHLGRYAMLYDVQPYAQDFGYFTKDRMSLCCEFGPCSFLPSGTVRTDFNAGCPCSRVLVDPLVMIKCAFQGATAGFVTYRLQISRLNSQELVKFRARVSVMQHKAEVEMNTIHWSHRHVVGPVGDVPICDITGVDFGKTIMCVSPDLFPREFKVNTKDTIRVFRLPGTMPLLSFHAATCYMIELSWNKAFIVQMTPAAWWPIDDGAYIVASLLPYEDALYRDHFGHMMSFHLGFEMALRFVVDPRQIAHSLYEPPTVTVEYDVKFLKSLTRIPFDFTLDQLNEHGSKFCAPTVPGTYYGLSTEYLLPAMVPYTLVQAQQAIEHLNHVVFNHPVRVPDPVVSTLPYPDRQHVRTPDADFPVDFNRQVKLTTEELQVPVVEQQQVAYREWTAEEQKTIITTAALILEEDDDEFVVDDAGYASTEGEPYEDVDYFSDVD